MKETGDIPEDIRKAAFAAVIRILDSLKMARRYDDDPVEVVARAILAERERCAEIAAEEAEPFAISEGFEHEMLLEVARRIRA